MKSEKGQVVLLVALIIVGLIGALALAVDGSMIMLDRRNAQAAADSAAIAGSYEIARNFNDPIGTLTQKAVTAAISRAADNGYTITAANVEYPITGNFNKVNNDPDTYNYIRVNIHSPVQTTFLDIIGALNPIINHVHATAYISPETSLASFGLIALAPSGCGIREEYGGLYMGGGGTLDITGGGILVNSSGDGSNGCYAMELSNNSIINAHTNPIVIVGTRLVSGTVSPVPLDHMPSYAMSFPPDGAPNIPTSSAYASYGFCASNAVITSTTRVYKGLTYQEMTPGNATAQFNKDYNIWMRPGVYCFPNGMSISNKAVYGDNVLVYITPQATKYEVSLLGSSSFELHNYDSDPYKGMVLFIDPKGYAAASQNYCSLLMSGSSTFNVDGTVYAPMCTITLGGSQGSTISAQVVGYKINLQGGSTFNVRSLTGNNFQSLHPMPGALNLSQ
jgi:hypothetical protein